MRLGVTVPYRAETWPRACIDPHLWRWTEVVEVRWPRGDGHINAREAQAVLTVIRSTTRCRQRLQSRFVRLADSQLCAAGLMKGRTSSKQLRPTVRKYHALSAAAALWAVLAYVVGKDN